MKYKTSLLSSRLSAEEAIARVGELLAKAGVQYKKEGLSIVSTRTPIALLSFQRVLYSDRNWVGLNPFTFISAVDVRCRLGRSGLTEVMVQVDRFRTFLEVAVSVSAAGQAAVGSSKTDNDIVFALAGVAAWFGFVWLILVSFLGGYLVKKEIADSLISRIQ